MGLVSSVGSRAMRPPKPPTYALRCEDGACEFEPPPVCDRRADLNGEWSPQNNYPNGCPIRFGGAARTEIARSAATLRHEVVLRPLNGRRIAMLRVFHANDNDDEPRGPVGDTRMRRRPTLLYSKGNSFDMGQLRYHCVELAALLDCDVLYYDFSQRQRAVFLQNNFREAARECEFCLSKTCSFEKGRRIRRERRHALCVGHA